ncbi:MAG: tetratricopeptide repeat protein [Candidatus Latescibacter sp.]|nr:tetratricopeptide repeat protein [Candidatus Latescibacter sp.]
MKKIFSSIKNFDIQTIGLIFVLILGTLVVYGQVHNYYFINIDDDTYVYENVNVKSGLNPQSIINSFTSTHGSCLWIPVTWLSLIVDYELFGLNPGGYHLTNVLFHIINTLLLFAFFRKTTGNTWRSAFVAALFALHPLHVESVAWITERKDVLSIFFMMMALYMYSKYVERPSLRKYVPVIVLFSLGIMAKPMIITFPVLLLLLDFWPFGRFNGGGKVTLKNSKFMKVAKVTINRIFIEKIPFFMISAIVFIVTLVVAKGGNALISLDSLSLPQRLQEAVLSYALYIGKMIVPRHLAFFYPYRSEAVPLWEVSCAGLLLMGITVLVIRLSRRFPWYPFGWFWYLVSLLPVIGIFQAGEQSMADRFTYMPLIGLFVMGVWGVSDSIHNWGQKKLILSMLMMVIIFIYGTITWVQVKHWKDTYSLLSHALTVTSKNYLAHQYIGYYYARHGKIEDAFTHFNEALKIDPSFARIHNDLGALLTRIGKYDEALAHFREALRLDPNYAEVHDNIGILYAGQGKTNEALMHYNEALKLKPNNDKVLNHIGILWYNFGNNDKALGYYNEALRLNPNYAEAHDNIGILYDSQGKTNEALMHYNKALKLDPNNDKVLKDIGILWYNIGNIDKALMYYNEALKLNPGNADTHKSIGIILYKEGKNNEAFSHFSEALQINPNIAEAYFYMGNILVQQEKYEEAIIRFKDAIRLKPDLVDARTNLAYIYKRLGKIDDATNVKSMQ